MPARPAIIEHPAFRSPPHPARLAFHEWRHAVGNFSLLKHRSCHGYIATMHQSGTHYLKFMLGHALSHHHGVAPPRFNHANDIIGGPKDAVIHPTLPRLLCSHSIPHALMWARACHASLPPYVLLVRDIRASLISNYEKWRSRYACSFDTFLAGDPDGRRYTSDLWWCFRFLNGWQRVRHVAPERVLVVRYESLCHEPSRELGRVAAHLKLAMTPADIAQGVAHGSKQTMLAHSDPARPPGIVNPGERPVDRYFTGDRQRWFAEACSRCLLDDFGYDYSTAAS